ncbi:MAG: formyltransferase family protein, partial [Desulfoplanes sp.]|nr:formyltransferase family protein [Desulfoplanes sp.]
MSLPIAVLISGSGTNLEAIISAIDTGRLDARITVVIANTPEAYGLERAKVHGLTRSEEH